MYRPEDQRVYMEAQGKAVQGEGADAAIKVPWCSESVASAIVDAAFGTTNHRSPPQLSGSHQPTFKMNGTSLPPVPLLILGGGGYTVGRTAAAWGLATAIAAGTAFPSIYELKDLDVPKEVSITACRNVHHAALVEWSVCIYMGRVPVQVYPCMCRHQQTPKYSSPDSSHHGAVL